MGVPTVAHSNVMVAAKNSASSKNNTPVKKETMKELENEASTTGSETVTVDAGESADDSGLHAEQARTGATPAKILHRKEGKGAGEENGAPDALPDSDDEVTSAPLQEGSTPVKIGETAVLQRRSGGKRVPPLDLEDTSSKDASGKSKSSKNVDKKGKKAQKSTPVDDVSETADDGDGEYDDESEAGPPTSAETPRKLEDRQREVLYELDLALADWRSFGALERADKLLIVAAEENVPEEELAKREQILQENFEENERIGELALEGKASKKDLLEGNWIVYRIDEILLRLLEDGPEKESLETVSKLIDVAEDVGVEEHHVSFWRENVEQVANGSLRAVRVEGSDLKLVRMSVGSTVRGLVSDAEIASSLLPLACFLVGVALGGRSSETSILTDVQSAALHTIMIVAFGIFGNLLAVRMEWRRALECGAPSLTMRVLSATTAYTLLAAVAFVGAAAGAMGAVRGESWLPFWLFSSGTILTLFYQSDPFDVRLRRLALLVVLWIHGPVLVEIGYFTQTRAFAAGPLLFSLPHAVSLVGLTLLMNRLYDDMDGDTAASFKIFGMRPYAFLVLFFIAAPYAAAGALSQYVASETLLWLAAAAPLSLAVAYRVVSEERRVRLTYGTVRLWIFAIGLLGGLFAVLVHASGVRIAPSPAGATADLAADSAEFARVH